MEDVEAMWTGAHTLISSWITFQDTCRTTLGKSRPGPDPGFKSASCLKRWWAELAEVGCVLSRGCHSNVYDL